MLHEIDEHLESFAGAEANEGLSANALKLFSICNIWHRVKPIVKLAHGLLFWRPRWQVELAKFTEVMDEICPA